MSEARRALGPVLAGQTETNRGFVRDVLVRSGRSAPLPVKPGFTDRAEIGREEEQAGGGPTLTTGLVPWMMEGLRDDDFSPWLFDSPEPVFGG